MVLATCFVLAIARLIGYLMHALPESMHHMRCPPLKTSSTEKHQLRRLCGQHNYAMPHKRVTLPEL